MTKQLLQGTVTAAFNPVDQDGSVDQKMLRSFCDFQIDSGVDALFVNGSTGEFAVLSIEMQKTAIKAYVDAADGRIPVVAHVGSTRQDEAFDLANYAESLGVFGIAAVPPFYYGFDKDALTTYFVALGKSAPNTPLYLYNFPAAARNDLTPQYLMELRKVCPQLAGVKDTTQDYCRYVDYVDLLGSDFSSMMGSDAMYLACMVIGGTGAISALAASNPEIMVGIKREYEAGNLDAARNLQKLASRLRHVFNRPAGQTRRKQVLALRGIAFPDPHAPMRSLTEAEKAEMKEELRRLEDEFSVPLLKPVEASN
ncbi:dihydrodipicolinate synthase family protein [Oceanidesulfovibrio marinus]|uniref:N-acetylneuraminate lyase n=1 Tax=Oceanidesulfovibrio marinus TaxID=370038 RepID=A0A6P1ZNH9_9BACT|nr:dihydrodipicolinate synthase family protein [Oceanidesulfovibrio marinus]TVM36784.1 hypothetical protein DQK91_02370 [Oceanidesulfovibrio marinus]